MLFLLFSVVLSCLRGVGEGEKGEAVTVEAEADVADVDLDDRGRDGGHGVGDGNRGVGVAARVEHNAAVGVKAHGLQAVHNLPLDVALEDIDRVLRELPGQFLQVLVERAVAIHLGLAAAHEVQVRAVDDVDVHFLK